MKLFCRITNIGNLYDFYSAWEGLCGYEQLWKYGVPLRRTEKDDIYKVLRIQEHGNLEDTMLCLIQDVETEEVFIMGLEGVELLIPEKEEKNKSKKAQYKEGLLLKIIDIQNELLQANYE